MIDSIILLLQNVKIYTDEKFDDEVDKIKEDTEDFVEEWEILFENYSKLNYLLKLINFHQIFQKTKFNECLSLFLEKIDKINQYYLIEICW